MLRKTLTALLAVLLLAVTVTAATAAGKPGQGSRMTICHKPSGEAAKTMEIPSSAWHGHQGHGDHQGACTDADRRGGASPGQPGPGPKPEAPRTPLWLTVDGEGGLDEASFKVVVRNPGEDAPLDVAVDGKLSGRGRWTADAPCAVDGQGLHCAFGDLPAGQNAVFRLRYETSLTLCRDVGVDLALSAANDATAGDDQVAQTVKVGACSPL